MFANKIGAMITLVMIEAIKPLNMDMPVSKERYQIENMTGEDRRKLATSWIAQGMNPFTIFSEFSVNLTALRKDSQFGEIKWSIQKRIEITILRKYRIVIFQNLRKRKKSNDVTFISNLQRIAIRN